MDKILDLEAKSHFFSIQANPERECYETIEQYMDWHKLRPALMDGTDLTKKMWEIRVYPNSPISFFTIIGNDLEVLIQTAIDALEMEYGR